MNTVTVQNPGLISTDVPVASEPAALFNHFHPLSSERLARLSKRIRPVRHDDRGILRWVETENFHPVLRSFTRAKMSQPASGLRDFFYLKTEHAGPAFLPSEAEVLAQIDSLPDEVKRRVAAYEVSPIPQSASASQHSFSNTLLYERENVFLRLVRKIVYLWRR